MKKIYLLLVALCGILASCQDDLPYREPNPADTEILLKKMVIIPADGTQQTIQYGYDGEKLQSVMYSDGRSETYNYTNNLLTEVRYYSNGGLVKKETYFYGDGNFVGYSANNYNLQNPANNFTQRFEYVTNGNTVTINEFRGDETSQNDLFQVKTLNIVNGNIKEVAVTGSSTQYLFDYKNAPFKNMDSYSILMLTRFEGGINNQIGRNVNGTITNIAYTYTVDEFPATATATGAQNYTVTYTY
ncbi:MAG: hypothetical protein V4581_06270 [Bacteroidota bacterium]